MTETSAPALTPVSTPVAPEAPRRGRPPGSRNVVHEAASPAQAVSRGMAQMVPLPDDFLANWDEDPVDDDAEAVLDEDSPDALLPDEPLGDEADDAGDSEAESADRPKLSVEEWADVLSAPDSEQRIAEVPAPQRGPVLKAFKAKIETASQATAQLTARAAYEQGQEAGRQALARELVVSNLDQMDAYDRQAYFAANPGSETLWHQAKAQVTTAPAAQANHLVEAIREEGRAHLGRLNGHPEYQKVYDEMAASKYAADASGLAALVARVERALATTPTTDEAEAAKAAADTNRAAKILKAAPRTRGIGSGGAAAGPLTHERLDAMSAAEVERYIATPQGEAEVDRLMAMPRRK